jgi:ceramide glucosyltransferase
VSFAAAVWVVQGLHWTVCVAGTVSALFLSALLLRGRGWASMSELPAVSYLVPFDGEEPDLGATLGFLASLPGEVLVATDGRNVPGLATVAELAKTHPGIVAVPSSSDEEAPANRKVWHLQRAAAVARHDVLFSIDSSVTPDRASVESALSTLLEEDRRGAAWISYATDRIGFVGRLAHIVFAATPASFVSADVVGRLFGHLPIAAGGMLACRREALDAVGGYGSAREILAEDIFLVQSMEAAGWSSARAPGSLIRRLGDESLGALFERVRRWNRSMFQRRDPMIVHFPLVVCPLVLSVVSTALVAIVDPPGLPLALALVGGLLVARWAMASLLLVKGALRPWTADVLWAVPAAELLLLGTFLRAATSSRVQWRGRTLSANRDNVLSRDDR